MKDNYYILEYSDSVPYEACWTETKPVLFNGTKEELEMEFEIVVEKVIENGNTQFNFNNLKDLPRSCFTYRNGRRLVYDKPAFYTFEEWCLTDRWI